MDLHGRTLGLGTIYAKGPESDGDASSRILAQCPYAANGKRVFGAQTVSSQLQDDRRYLQVVDLTQGQILVPRWAVSRRGELLTREIVWIDRMEAAETEVWVERRHSFGLGGGASPSRGK